MTNHDGRATTPIPLHLQEKLRAFVAEEVISSLRHSVVNDLTALAALCYRLKIEHLPDIQDEGSTRAAHELLEKIQGYVKVASRRMELSFLPCPSPPPTVVEVGALLRMLVAQMPAPSDVSLEGPAPGAVTLSMDGPELELALACLLANAYEALAGGGRVRLRCGPGPSEMIRIEVEHDGALLEKKVQVRVFEPFFSTKPGRLGLGLNVVRRIAARWGGTVDLEAGASSGVIASLSLPAGASADRA